MASHRRFLNSLIASCLGLTWVVACSVDDGGVEDGTACFGPSCVLPDSGTQNGNSATIDAAPSVDESPPAPVLDPLCGEGSCDPRDLEACQVANLDFGDGERPYAQQLEGGLAADAGSGADARAPSDPDGASSGDASLSSDAGSVEDSGVGPDTDADPLPPGPPEMSCQLRFEAGETQRSCVSMNYGGAVGAPCTSGADCARGLGCVGEEGAGYCLEYCCGGVDQCSPGSYCAQRPLRDMGLSTRDAPPIPVCVPADRCMLDEPYPCDQADSCKCGAGTACTVVRDDGTTSCVVPGEGEAGEACPCAPGFFCSQSTGTCLQICDARKTAPNPCGSGRCQTATTFPDGFGICVAVAQESVRR